LPGPEVEGGITILIIGELINASIKSVRSAVVNKDTRFLQELARKQAARGVDYLDVNTATGRGSRQEAEDMAWAVQVIQEAVDIPLAIDTADPRVLKAGLQVHCGRAMVNSLSADPDRLEPFLELAKEYHCLAAVLPTREQIPAQAEERLTICAELLARLVAGGLAAEDIYFDALVLPLCVNGQNPQIALQTLKGIKKLGAQTIAGLSNVSFGMPRRDLLNCVFLVLARQAGLDAVILNPLENNLLPALKAAEALLGYDEYCTSFLRAYRQGKLD